MQCKQLPNSSSHRPVDCANMLRLVTTSLCLYCQRAQATPLLLTRPRSVIVQEENLLAVNALYDLSVDISKVRKLRGWVLRQSPVYVSETAALLRDMGASGPVIARVLELHPEAILCKPDQMEAQKKLWMSVCASQKDLVGIIEKFPASFFTLSSDHDNQKANIVYFQTLHLNKRIISKLMASAPQSFSRPVEQNEQMIQTLQKTYLDLGGKQVNMKIWLQKLLTQNPYVLLKLPDALHDNLAFLRNVGFTSDELLRLLSKLKGFVTELNPESMRLTLSYSQETLGCTEAELRQIVLQCPALLYYSVPILADRFKGLLTSGVSMEQIMETPTVLELTTQIVQYRIQKLRSFSYDVRSGSLEVLNGTKKDFEMSYGKLCLRQERPLFNPVAPLRSED
ncbi:transcription termination factor 2, mitochondrial [Onychostoma macrolepis]|uniref:transcription termination factor 2, mitochondrial n=1 Tax=Onychostoma macrolepis TaxID=369639 RepID=UPI00272D4E4C|nr:transcription termination factor 2, mitochondrial [Onychostoma macrolepis]XP_058608212.1 transcription termination factor 2, mitochondrial [Onychostoma macrolepis]XP_058608213.1 transcription termination factor 2, mitochondrial [Onychostoma macrolepis]